MLLIKVAISGSVGKQVVPTTKQGTLYGMAVHLSAANTTVAIREGGGPAASGDVVFFYRGMSAQTRFQHINFPAPVKFTRGLHVLVLGGAAEAYLYLDK